MSTSSKLTVYSFQNVAVVINGAQIEGLWEGDDAVMIEPNSDIGNPVVGVDGSSLVSITADRAVKITLKLQPTSPAHEFLQNRFRQMRSGSFSPFPISVRDTGNGEGGSAAEAVIIQAPSRQFGENAASRDWVLFAGAWEENPIAYA